MNPFPHYYRTKKEGCKPPPYFNCKELPCFSLWYHDTLVRDFYAEMLQRVLFCCTHQSHMRLHGKWLVPLAFSKVVGIFAPFLQSAFASSKHPFSVASCITSTNSSLLGVVSLMSLIILLPLSHDNNVARSNSMRMNEPVPCRLTCDLLWGWTICAY